MDLDSVSVHKHVKKERGQYPAILTSRLVNNPYIFFSCGILDYKWVLFMQICHRIGLRAVYKPLAIREKIHRPNERVTQILEKERCIEEQIYFELLYVSCT